MLKITFTTPQEIIQHGLPGQALFVLCESAELSGGWFRIEFGDGYDFVKIENVKSVRWEK